MDKSKISAQKSHKRATKIIPKKNIIQEQKPSKNAKTGKKMGKKEKK